MRKIIILTLLVNILCCKAQEGKIESLNTSSLDILSGTYLKDLDNDMPYYIGTWRGVYNGKYIVVKIIKLTKNKIFGVMDLVIIEIE